jgi:hypothetical protein
LKYAVALSREVIAGFPVHSSGRALPTNQEARPLTRTRFTALVVALSLAASTMGVALSSEAASAATTPGLLGGMNVAGYCLGLGYEGTPSLGQATLLTGSITGTNAAYGNWACVAGSGATTTIAVGGAAPSFSNLCAVQFPGVASYPAPTDANNAYTWNCYLLPPASGPGVGAEVQAATTAVLQNALVQNEIVQLQALVSSHKSLQAIATGLQFLGSRPVQELIDDVLAAYGLPNQGPAVTALLAGAITRAVLNLP